MLTLIERTRDGRPQLLVIDDASGATRAPRGSRA